MTNKQTQNNLGGSYYITFYFYFWQDPLPAFVFLFPSPPYWPNSTTTLSSNHSLYYIGTFQYQDNLQVSTYSIYILHLPSFNYTYTYIKSFTLPTYNLHQIFYTSNSQFTSNLLHFQLSTYMSIYNYNHSYSLTSTIMSGDTDICQFWLLVIR